MKSFAYETETEAEDPDFKPMTAQEAQEWRRRTPVTSVWRLVVWQAVVGVSLALLCWAITRNAGIAKSVAYGALAVVLPSALFARGISRRGISSGAAMLGFFGWELIKIVVTVAMLVAAPRLVTDLHWLALLGGMVVSMKTYWFALLAVRPRLRKTDSHIDKRVD